MNDRRLSSGDQVRSARFGIGTVRLDDGATVIVRFAHGVEECERASLEPLSTPLQALDHGESHVPLEVIARVQAEAIVSVNDTWGVFSRSRIELLPHQLWVCRRVLERWPARWLVADDVGLGKTIEAGLILWPLLSRGRVRRLLILCPASLVEQWQWRLREMFDIRLARYLPELDTPKAGFWDGQTHVVASLQTLRSDHGGRHERLLASEPWDLVLVDEAHHLNADEEAGPTLGYRLIERLDQAQRIDAMVFFTGTPHRGKEFGFWSLLRLLRPDLFDPRKPARAQLPLLNGVMIRNNKQNVTDLRGRRLFQAPRVAIETYAYSPAEAHFYAMLTEFIVTGRAYASGLSGSNGRAVGLVLIAMQKLASSSVAAIRRALRRRLDVITRAEEASRAAAASRSRIAEYEAASRDDDLDLASRLEEEIVNLGLLLMVDEAPRLRELIAAADAVTEETKVAAILSILKMRFAGRPVLLFTEYKATQSLLMSSLIREFGEGCVTFINGDERAEEVVDSHGVVRTVHERRERAAERFNSGEVRFLISTEAGGEGIDLQERCHSLIHVDLPWNPMRLHQRVGRLNRYGKTRQVEVVSLRNPDTVESLIWDRLNAKIDTIMVALREVMDEPEDLLELVLGMTSPSIYRELFAGAQEVPRESLAAWFDRQTSQLGGQDVVDAVRELVGHAARFDYQQVSDRLPRVDLPALRPFFRAMLALNGRRVREDEAGGLSFLTPDEWRDDRGILPEYEGLLFDRTDRSREVAARIVGVGHRAFDRAVGQAREYGAAVSSIPDTVLPHPLLAFSISDRVTTEATPVRFVTVGVEFGNGDGEHRFLADWELLDRLNEVLSLRGPRRLRAPGPPPDAAAVRPVLELAVRLMEEALPRLDVPFKMPAVTPLAVLWPSTEAATDSDRGWTELPDA